MAKNFNKATTKQLLKKIETSQKTLHENPSMKIIDIPVDKLIENPKNSQIYDMDELEPLVLSIKDIGVKTPILVYKMQDGNYMICGGHRRTRAAKAAGLKKIPAIVEPWIESENDRTIYLLNDNIANRRTKSLERAKEIEEYIMAYQGQDGHESFTPSELKEIACERFHITRGTCDKLLNLLKLIPELQEKSKDEKTFSYSALAYARGMSTEQQIELNNKLDEFMEEHGNDSINREIIRDLALMIKGKKKTPTREEFITEPDDIEDDASAENTTSSLAPLLSGSDDFVPTELAAPLSAADEKSESKNCANIVEQSCIQVLDSISHFLDVDEKNSISLNDKKKALTEIVRTSMYIQQFLTTFLTEEELESYQKIVNK